MTLRVTKLRPKIDKLIDWYKEFKPGVDKINVDMTVKECQEFAHTRDGVLTYRGFTIVPGKTKKPGKGHPWRKRQAPRR